MITRENIMTITTDTKDPICGMAVDESSALHAEREGKAFYFCSDHCRRKFLSAPKDQTQEQRTNQK